MGCDGYTWGRDAEFSNREQLLASIDVSFYIYFLHGNVINDEAGQRRIQVDH
jgi:hypothetical protein